MIRSPIVGDLVRVHYNPQVAKIAPHHGQLGVIRQTSKGPGPRNVGIQIGRDTFVVLPLGNICKTEVQSCDSAS